MVKVSRTAGGRQASQVGVLGVILDQLGDLAYDVLTDPDKVMPPKTAKGDDGIQGDKATRRRARSMRTSNSRTASLTFGAMARGEGEERPRRKGERLGARN